MKKTDRQSNLKKSNTLDLDTKVKLSSNLLTSDISGEAVILSPKSGIYYGLNETGATIWSKLQQQPKKVAELRESILTEYEVTSEECDRDLQEVLQDLLDNGLIEVVNETTS